MLFSLLKHYLEIYITDAALKVSRSLYCFPATVSLRVKNYIPRLWGTGISDAIFFFIAYLDLIKHSYTEPYFVYYSTGWILQSR